MSNAAQIVLMLNICLAINAKVKVGVILSATPLSGIAFMISPHEDSTQMAIL